MYRIILICLVFAELCDKIVLEIKMIKTLFKKATWLDMPSIPFESLEQN
jgi:hypothetical protein